MSTDRPTTEPHGTPAVHQLSDARPRSNSGLRAVLSGAEGVGAIVGIFSTFALAFVGIGGAYYKIDGMDKWKDELKADIDKRRDKNDDFKTAIGDRVNLIEKTNIHMTDVEQSISDKLDKLDRHVTDVDNKVTALSSKR